MWIVSRSQSVAVALRKEMLRTRSNVATPNTYQDTKETTWNA